MTLKRGGKLVHITPFYFIFRKLLPHSFLYPEKKNEREKADKPDTHKLNVSPSSVAISVCSSLSGSLRFDQGTAATYPVFPGSPNFFYRIVFQDEGKKTAL